MILFTPTYNGVIHQVSAAGGVPQAVTVLDSAYADQTHRWARFLPDGRHFLFFARTGSSSGSEQDAVCAGSLDGPEVVRLVRCRSTAAHVAGHLLYVLDGVLMAQPFDAGSLEMRGDAMPVVEDVSHVENWARAMFDVSDAGHLVYRRGVVNIGSQLTLVDVEGRPLATIGESVQQYNFAISPDGSRIAVEVEDPATANMDIWIHDLDRGIRSRLTFDEAADRAPVWTPDGQSIVYFSSRAAQRGLYLKSVSGMDPATLLLASQEPLWPECVSADGSLLLYIQSSAQTGDDVWALPLDGGEPFSYLESTFDEGWADLSPDGRWVAYMSEESGKEEVYVSPFPTPTGKWQISTNEGDRPSWSPDGSRLYYLDNDDHVMVAAVDGTGDAFRVGKVERLFEVPAAARPGAIFNVFDDGERFLINTRGRDVPNDRLVLVHDWAVGLRDRGD